MFKLTAKSKIEIATTYRKKPFVKTEDVYTYESDDGAKVTFHSHPTKAWNYVLVAESTNDAGRKVASDVIDRWSVALSNAVSSGNNVDAAISAI